MNARGRTQFAPTEKDREFHVLCPFSYALQDSSVTAFRRTVGQSQPSPVGEGGSRKADG